MGAKAPTATMPTMITAETGVSISVLYSKTLFANNPIDHVRASQIIFFILGVAPDNDGFNCFNFLPQTSESHLERCLKSH